jgi:hypothetical protein
MKRLGTCLGPIVAALAIVSVAAPAFADGLRFGSCNRSSDHDDRYDPDSGDADDPGSVQNDGVGDGSPETAVKARGPLLPRRLGSLLLLAASLSTGWVYFRRRERPSD